MRQTVAIDFDGVIHQYSRGWCGGEIYDLPMPGVEHALSMLFQTHDLVIYTVREDLVAVRAWLDGYDLLEFFKEVTNTKPIATLYIDDRALRFTDWETALPEAGRILEIS